jgi:uncharacterized CHY-type Zn-finger protein
MTLKDTDKLIELIDDDIASLDMNMSTESYYACLCTLQMVKLYIKALPTVPLDWKSIMNDWTEHDNAMIAKGRELERRLNAPKHARWIPILPEIGLWKCSNCRKSMAVYNYRNYCPNCGARMDEVITHE